MNKALGFRASGRANILALGILILAVSWQHFACEGILGVKPNLILIAVILAAMVVEPIWYFAVLLLASIGIEFSPGIGLLSFGLLGSGMVIYWIRYRLLADGLAVVFLLTLLGTGLFYIIVDYKFILSSYNVVFIEFLYNLIISYIGFGIYKFFINEEK